jgi:hypothetical protein
MRRIPLFILVLAAAGAMSASTATGVGLTRVPNTTLRLPPAPPVFGYSATPAFGNLSFPVPVAIASPANRLFELQVTTNLATPQAWSTLDVAGNRPIPRSTPG